MTQSVEEIFGELGISQYLDAFIEQGFDNWDTILDITESDLYASPKGHVLCDDGLLSNQFRCRDALGVKLGHRRVR